MRNRLRGRKAWFVIAAVGVAVAGVVGVTRWLTRERPVPEVPRPGPSAFTEREVQMDVAGAGPGIARDPSGGGPGGGRGRGRPGRRRVPRRLGRPPGRRKAGAIAAVRDLSPAGPHVLRRLPGRAGGGGPGS